ncbi:hypothetical protein CHINAEXTREME_00975 [Halobiforma lacisalsi AJ5]|uniref:DUF7968 domain-containing protein n=2 Tax=Natronobacterium TaxID=2256 RepID=M0LH99_NATLA|nr:MULTISPECIES: hypothetical protein [Halobiforma]APW96420.1 hypothetical protein CHINAEXTREME_00975 [Halobiforma lacisalsi AJ5]EMA31809.1 hypothetical protein C445_13380 [Halobiforma lacisalsi AJ5]SFB71117.1 hypothetical protein SAMN05444422_101388 [Halobiforma haloterrestris]
MNDDAEIDAAADERGDERETAADRVTVSYPADLSDWGRFQVEKPSFRAFLRKTRDEAREGDRWEEFVGVGCCGNTLDVPLRVEHVAGGPRIDEETEIEYEVREACDLEGGWEVQSEASPENA